MEHILKTDSDVFEAVKSGKKTYEIRYNDRNFKVGDILILRETLYAGSEMKEGKPLKYTGRQYEGVVIHVLIGPLYGLEKGWAILSLSKI